MIGKLPKSILLVMLISLSNMGIARDQLDRGFYFGGQYGLTKVDFNGYFDVLEQQEKYSFSPYLGYRVEPHFSIEGNSFAIDGAGETEYSALSIMPTISPRLNDFLGLYFQFGLAFVDFSQFDKIEDRERNWDGVSMTAGMGTELLFDNGIVFRAGYQYIVGELKESNSNRSTVSENADVSIGRLTVGVHYQF